MTGTEIPWWMTSIVSVIGQTVILVVLTLAARKASAQRPITARLFYAAAAMDGLSLLGILVSLSDVFSVGTVSFGSGGPKLTDPAVIQMLIMQGFQAVCSIASWSLVAWAILRQPDERRRKSPPVAS